MTPTTVIPVFFFTDVALGGYGFTPLQISLFITLGGLSQSIWLLLVFPPLQKRIGTGGVLRACAVVWPILFFMVAAGNMFLRRGWNITFWIVAPTSLVIGSGVAMAFSKLTSFGSQRTMQNEPLMAFYQRPYSLLSTISRRRQQRLGC